MANIEVTEVRGGSTKSGGRCHEFTVTECLGADGHGFYVEARGPRGSTLATVFGDVTVETVVGAKFYRS